MEHARRRGRLLRLRADGVDPSAHVGDDLRRLLLAIEHLADREDVLVDPVQVVWVEDEERLSELVELRGESARGDREDEVGVECDDLLRARPHATQLR